MQNKTVSGTMTVFDNLQHKFVICIRNDDYPASLETRKIYAVIPDREAEKQHQVRVIDESGEDFLFPQDYFIPVKLPKVTEETLLKLA